MLLVRSPKNWTQTVWSATLTALANAGQYRKPSTLAQSSRWSFEHCFVAPLLLFHVSTVFSKHSSHARMIRMWTHTCLIRSFDAFCTLRRPGKIVRQLYWNHFKSSSNCLTVLYAVCFIFAKSIAWIVSVLVNRSVFNGSNYYGRNEKNDQITDIKRREIGNWIQMHKNLPLHLPKWDPISSEWILCRTA